MGSATGTIDDCARACRTNPTCKGFTRDGNPDRPDATSPNQYCRLFSDVTKYNKWISSPYASIYVKSAAPTGPQPLDLTSIPIRPYAPADPIYDYNAKEVPFGADCWPLNLEYGTSTPTEVAKLCQAPSTCANHPRPKMVKMLGANVRNPPPAGSQSFKPSKTTGTSEECIQECDKIQNCGGFTRSVGTRDDDANGMCSWVPMTAISPLMTVEPIPKLFEEAVVPDSSKNLWRKQPPGYPSDSLGAPRQKINPLWVQYGPRGCGKYLPMPTGWVAARQQNIGNMSTTVVNGATFASGTVKDCTEMCDGTPACKGFRRTNDIDDDEVGTCVFVTGTPYNNPTMDAFDMFYKK